MSKINPNCTVISVLTGNSKSTASTAFSSTSSGPLKHLRKKWNKHRPIPPSVAVEIFKGGNIELKGFFCKGSSAGSEI